MVVPRQTQLLHRPRHILVARQRDSRGRRRRTAGPHRTAAPAAGCRGPVRSAAQAAAAVPAGHDRPDHRAGQRRRTRCDDGGRRLAGLRCSSRCATPRCRDPTPSAQIVDGAARTRRRPRGRRHRPRPRRRQRRGPAAVLRRDAVPGDRGVHDTGGQRGRPRTRQPAVRPGRRPAGGHPHRRRQAGRARCRRRAGPRRRSAAAAARGHCATGCPARNAMSRNCAAGRCWPTRCGW